MKKGLALPYPSRIDHDVVLSVARDLIATDGAAGLSLHRIARTLDVKAPSLYRYFRSKNALLKAVNEDTMQRLYALLGGVLDDNRDAPATTQLLAVGRAYRQFAFENPNLYGLLFDGGNPDALPDLVASEQGILRFQHTVAALTGEAASLAALRGYLALVHGFVLLENAGQFRRGGSLDAAFEQALRFFINGLHRAGL